MYVQTGHIVAEMYVQTEHTVTELYVQTGHRPHFHGHQGCARLMSRESNLTRL